MPTLRQKLEFSQNAQEQVLYRLLEATRSHTLQDLADFFAVSLHRARKATKVTLEDGTIPDAWLVMLIRVQNVHPEWILTGCGPRFIYVRRVGHYESAEVATERQKNYELLRTFSAFDLTQELLRRTMPNHNSLGEI